MKKFILACLFLVYGLSVKADIIVVSVSNGTGAGTLHDAILKANASVATSGSIDFNITISSSGGYFPNPTSYPISLSQTLPVLNKSNWTISQYAYFSYINIPSSPFPARTNYPVRSPLVINGNNMFGPGLVMTGSNDVCNIPASNFINFKARKYLVTNTNDNGAGSLREAIMFANSTSAKDTIHFSIGGSAPYTINLSSALPLLMQPMLIDGTTQPGYVDGEEIVSIDGQSLYNGFTLYGCNNLEIYGLTFKNCDNGITTTETSSENAPSISFLTIGKKGKSNTIIRCKRNGIKLSVSAPDLSISNNYIGTNSYGDSGLSNESGLCLNATRCTISENVISGNRQYGIRSAYTYTMVNNGMNTTLNGSIVKNKIGTNPSGTAALPNNVGIGIENPHNLVIEKNVISGNKLDGVAISVGYGYILNILRSQEYIKTYLYSNYIGTDSTAGISIPNGGNGISTDSYDYGFYYIKGNTIANNKKAAINTANATSVKNNVIFNNGLGVKSTALASPVITNRTVGSFSGTAPAGTIVQLFYDDGLRADAQGKEFIGEVYPVSGTWTYPGSIANPCAVTAIAIDTVKRQSSKFSLGAVFSLGPDITVCQGDSVFLDGKDGFNSYQWSTGETTRTIKVLQAGKYSVIVDNGCIYNDTIEVIYMNKPTVSLGKDTTVCSGQPFVLNAANAGATYLWSTNYTNQTYNATTTGVYNVKVSYDRCSNSDTIKVVVLTVPAVNLGLDAYKCDLDSVTLYGGTVYNRYLWSTGDTTNTLKVKQSGTYWVKSSNDCFASSASDTIKVSLAPVIVHLGKDTTLCAGQSLRLGVTNKNASYMWTGTAGTNYYSTSDSVKTVTTAGTYIATVALGSCRVNDTIIVSVVSRPAVNLGADRYLCEMDSIQFDAGSAVSYQWSAGNTSRYFTAKNDGKFWVKVSNSQYCFSSDTIILTATQCNIIGGIVYKDVIQNCTKDASELIVAEKIIVLTNTTSQENYYAYTDSSGYYSAKLPIGTYKIQAAPQKGYTVICPSSPYTVTLNHTSALTDKHFGVRYTAINELVVSVGIPSRIRPESVAAASIQYSNSGTTTMAGQVYFIKDPFLVLQTSTPMYDQIKGDTLIWNFANLAPDEKRNIRLSITAHLTNGIIGSYVFNKAIINPLAGDQNVSNNTYDCVSLITYAVDPNDKISDKGAIGNITTSDSTFHYKIHFQNTGNDSAHTVVIRDTLSPNLNVVSFVPGASSHSYTTDVSGKGIITFTFKNIMLPDSSTDFEKSSGYVTYAINLKPQASVGTVVNNTAAIYFDLASPVITNTTSHTIVNHMAVQNLNLPVISDKEYLDSVVTLNAQTNSGLPIHYSWLGPVSMQNGKLQIEGTGDVRVRVYQEGDGSFYPASYVDRTFHIYKSNQVITVATIPDQDINNVSIDINGVGGLSGNSIVYSVVSGPAQLNDNTLSLLNIGAVVLKVSQSGNDNFNDATDVFLSFNIVSGTTNISDAVDANFKTYPNPAIDYVEVELSTPLEGKVSIISISGTIVSVEKILDGKVRCDVSDLEAGSYILKIESENIQWTKKLNISR